MQYGICEWSAMAGGEALFARLRLVGLQGVQVSYEGDFAEKMRRYTDFSAAYGVTLTSVGANNFCDRAIFRQSTQELITVTEDICRGAAQTQGKLFHVPAFCDSYIENEEQLRATAAALRTVCDVAADYGVRPATENALSLADNRRLFEMVDRGNLAMYFDTQNPQTTAHPDAAAQAEAFAPCIVEVHVKDCAENGRSVPLGEGVTGFVDTVAALCRGGYDGWMHLENAYDRAPDPEEAMRADLQRLKRIVSACHN